MATSSESRQIARFGQILKTLFGSIRRHWRGLIALALLLHFLVWKLMTEFAVSFPQYCHDLFGWNVFDLEKLFAHGVVISLIYFIVLQAALITLVSREFEPQQAGSGTEPFLREGIKGLRKGDFLFDVGRSWAVLWRMFFRISIVGALTAGVILAAGFAWKSVSGSDVNLLDLAIPNFSIAAVVAYLLLRSSLALPITIVEGHSAKLSIKRSRQLTSLRRSKVTIWLCLLAYAPIIALILIGSQVDITENVGGVAMWFILTVTVLFTSLMATGCYLFIRPGELKV